MLGLGEWSLETTLTVFAVAEIIIFFILYFFFRGLGYLLRLPGNLKRRAKAIRFNRSQEALVAGLVNSAVGNWEKAESILIKHASHSGAPLLHYLTAAKAAQSRGALDKRDEYLKKAAEKAPDSMLAVGLTQAELHLSGNQFDEALVTLKKLHSIDPGHASVLKLLHQTYKYLGDWEGLCRLLPSLHAHNVLMESEIKLLETETFSKLLKEATATGNVSSIQQRWVEIPTYIRRIAGVSAIYFAAMINAGAGADIEDELALALSVDWDATLLALFGSLQSSNVFKQLEMAEGWLVVHENDSLLFAILGKLCLKCNKLEKARTYLERSIAIEPTVLAYQLLGELLANQGDLAAANQCYKNGLELASSEVVNYVDYANKAEMT